MGNCVRKSFMAVVKKLHNELKDDGVLWVSFYFDFADFHHGVIIFWIPSDFTLRWSQNRMSMNRT